MTFGIPFEDLVELHYQRLAQEHGHPGQPGADWPEARLRRVATARARRSFKVWGCR